VCDDNLNFFAGSDIASGDELTVDYSTYSAPVPKFERRAKAKKPGK
jgi:hypothetical protein